MHCSRVRLVSRSKVFRMLHALLQVKIRKNIPRSIRFILDTFVGNWSSPLPACNPVQCPSLFIEDPHLSLTELNTSAWGRAIFKCSWGYRLSGPSSLECQSDGTWNGPTPRCRAIQCSQPLVPINGRIDGTSTPASNRKYAVGALVTFSCNEGHLLVGEASIVCTETGFWSHPPPFCAYN